MSLVLESIAPVYLDSIRTINEEFKRLIFGEDVPEFVSKNAK